MDKKLNEAVAALRPQMVAALQRLVRRRSVEADPLPGKPFGEEVDACFAEALTLCHELGFETTDMDRYIGWCEIGTGDEMVAVLGHLDVVPEGEGWHHPPYAAEIEGDAQHLWVKLNYRYPVTMERADCQPAVQAAFEAAGWALDGQVHKEKLYYPAETPLVSALLEVYRDATGDNAPPKCIGGGTYAKMLPNVVAFGPLFAGDPVTEHQPDECIDLERLVQNAQIIANAIVKLANLPLE